MTPGNPAWWVDWLSTRALPLWSTAGFDAATASFVERLALDGSPQRDVPRRVMVQARQVHAFATAARNGWLPGAAELALTAGETMIARYYARGGRDGWAFSVDRSGVVVDDRRDLYAHAFVLLALSALVRLDATPRYRDLIRRTMTFLDREMAHPAGGYIEQWPAAVLPRRQNPHMHLLEAFLALEETGGCGEWFGPIARLMDLFDGHFCPANHSCLRECYDADWIAVGQPGFEPGHHFEWIWLLTRYAALGGIAMDDRIGRLMGPALLGIDPRGRVVEHVATNGTAKPTYRLWAAMEAAKAFATAQGRAVHPAGMSEALMAGWQAFCSPSVAGGWWDRVAPSGMVMVDYIPASSLYHICTAIDYVATTPVNVVSHKLEQSIST
jgi:mannose/cellobiose epimerase-like protein (N-acyl-D-glucosamine 2-epimerase family)